MRVAALTPGVQAVATFALGQSDASGSSEGAGGIHRDIPHGRGAGWGVRGTSWVLEVAGLTRQLLFV